MSNSVLNTEFEISLRILLTLSTSNDSGLTLDSIVTSDFITIYTKEFGLSNSNLHGNNDFSFAEFSSRRLQARESIKSLVLDNMVSISEESDGFHYSITDQGQSFCDTLTSEYSKEYLYYALKVKEYMKSKSEKELLSLISREASKSLKRR